MYSKSNVYVYADVIRGNIENVSRDYAGHMLYAYALRCFIYLDLLSINITIRALTIYPNVS